MTKRRMDELEQQVQSLEAKLDAYKTKYERLVQLLCDDKADFAGMDVAREPSILSRLDQHDEKIDGLRDDVAVAIATAKARADGSGQDTKVEIAKTIARNEVVRRAAKEPGQNSRVKATKVQDLASPKHELAYQTVKDALRDLKQDYRELRVRTDPRALELAVDKVTRELTAVADQDLADVEATKRLISENTSGRGSA